MSDLWKRLRAFAQRFLELGKARVFQNLGWLAGGQLAGDVVAFLFFILLSRRFGPEGVGIYAFGVALASLGRTIASLGVDDFGVRELATRKEEEATAVVGRILGTQCWLVVAYIVGCALFLAVVEKSALTMAVVGLLTVYHLSAGVARSLFLPAFAERRMTGPAVLDAGSRILAVLGGIAVMMVGGDTLVGVLLGFPICGFLLLVGAIWLAYRDLGTLQIQLHPRSVISIAKRAWPFAAGGIVFKLYARADVVMLSIIVGSAATGTYAAGLKFVEVSTMIIAMFAFALYPRLTHLAQNDKSGFEIAVNTLVKGGFVASVILGWGIFVFVPYLIPLLFGAQFEGSEMVVKLFALLVPFMGVNILADRLMLAAGKQVPKLRFQTIATGLNIVFNGVLIPLIAIEGAIVASMVSFAVNTFLVVRYLRQYSSESLLRRLCVEVCPYLAVGGLVAGLGAYSGLQDMWVAIAFLMSFVGALVVSGFATMMWSGVTQLSERSGV